MTKIRLFFSFLGLLAVAALVWFAGPLIAFGGHAVLEGEVSRLVVILIIVLLWSLNLLRKVLAANNANQQIREGIAPAKEAEKPVRLRREAEGHSLEEVAVLRERFREALEVLRKSGTKGANLYELPWYIVIGPPGAGKTTALKNSGLEFPLADRFGTEALRGVGGTRNCDWWFTNEAVLVDTAGRYVTQDSDRAVDSAAWQAFLVLLKRYRRRRPINGIMVAISIADVIVQGEEERHRHVRAIKQRIQELNASLGFRFPVYLVFTKADLVAGFMEFFDDLGREGRAQVWGMTFPLDEAEGVKRFSAEYDNLIGRLNDRLLWRLDEERDPRRRSLIYGFPQQMATLQEAIGHFINGIFHSTRFDEPLLLRGVYFTSGTQEGTPIDRVMGAVARSFGLDAQALGALSGTERSYFVSGLLQRVIFPEAELVGTNRRVERRRTWLQRFAYGTAVATLVGAVAVWSAAFTRNQAYINRLQERVNAYNDLAKKELRVTAAFGELLPRLDALRATTQVYRDYPNAHSTLWELGIYQGDRLGAAAQGAYLRELNRGFAPRIAARIAEQLRNAGRQTDPKYAALKVYLMLSNLEHLDPAFLKAWLQLDWERAYAREPDKIERFSTHLDALLDGGLQPVALDENLIKETRQALNRVPLAELVYSRLKRDALARDQQPFVPREVLGPLGSKVFERRSGTGLDQGIPGFFTYRGYYQVFVPESKLLAQKIRSENWVMENDRDELSAAELAKLDDDVSALYLAEYGRAWEELVKDLRVVSFRSPAHGLEVLEVMSGRNSALRILLQAIEQNTSLTRPPGGAGELADKLSEGLKRTKQELAQLLGAKAGAREGEAEPLLPGSAVEKRFADLNVLVRPDKNGVVPIDPIIEQLSKLYAELDAVNTTELTDPARKEEGAASRRLKETAVGQPPPVKDWLLQLTGSATEVTGKKQQADVQKKLSEDKKSLLQKINGIWTSDIVPFCNKAVANRYPIHKDSREEATLKDFARLFGPGGLIDTFVNDHLKPFIDNTSDPWRWRPANDIDLGASDEVLRRLETAAMIRDSYFHDGGQLPTVEFALKPILLDKDVRQFSLDIGGQRFVYQHGPAQLKTARWPAPDGGLEVRLGFEDASGKSATRTKEGPWALFRLFDEIKLESVTADRLVATFQLEGHTAQYELRATSVINPFLVEGIHSFQCPKGF